MATTEEFKNGGNTSYSFSIEYIKASDIKVEIDGSPLTYTTNTNPSSGQYKVVSTTVTLGAAAAAGSGNVHIFRETDLDTAAAVFAAGSSIRAADLNACHDMVRLASQEQQQLQKTPDIKDQAVTSAKIKDATIVDADISGSAAIAQSKIATGLLPSGITVNSANIVDGSIVNDDINNSAAIAGTKISPDFGSQNIVTTGTVDGRNVSVDGTKLDTIETNAKDDQTASEIKTLYESNSNTNEFSDTEQTKLAGIETAATGDQTAGEIKTLLQSNKLELSEINTTSLDSRYYTETEAEGLFLRQDSSETIASGVTWSGTDAKVATTAAIDLRIIDLVDDVGGFVAIANETSFPTANPDVNNGTGTVVSVKAASTNLAPSGTTVTIANGAGSGNTVTVTGVTATIPSGYGFLVETTSTLHTYTFHRLVPKATEVSTVAANAVNIAAAGANVTNIDSFADRYQISTSAPTQRSDSSSLTNGDLWFDSSSNKVMMVYDGSAGDGYSPITPNQSDLTNINIVAGQITYTEDLGLITNAVNTGSGNNSVNTVGSNIASVNTTAGSIANVNTVATNIANVNTTAGSIANVNNVGASIADVNRYANEYVIQSGTPSSPSSGDLWYNSTANSLNYYNGSSWVAIAPGIAGLINDASPALANHLDCNDKNLTEVGTVSGNNLQIDFGTL